MSIATHPSGSVHVPPLHADSATARQLAIVRAVAHEVERRPFDGRRADALRQQLVEELERLADR